MRKQNSNKRNKDIKKIKNSESADVFHVPDFDSNMTIADPLVMVVEHLYSVALSIVSAYFYGKVRPLLRHNYYLLVLRSEAFM